MLYPYQQTFVDNILIKLKNNQRVLAQLPTGAGKTHSFCHIINKADQAGKRVLVLVHRDELVGQTIRSLNKHGVISESLTSKKRKLKHHTNCIVAMVETAYNRLSKDSLFLRNIDVVIADEVHIQVFEKVYNLLPNSKVIGFTATPVILKRSTFYKCDICNTRYEELMSCCGSEVMEWTEPGTLKNQYDDIVVGIGIDELIEKNKLVREISLIRKGVDTSKLKTDKSGDYTEKSQNHAFGASESIQALVSDYEKICKGKKVMIFTGSTKVNALLEDAFNNYNARIFDTVNSSEKRTEVVDWFKSERDAILISTGIFTAGFDCTDVEVIIMYRATKSLALYIQIVGRGARVTDKIFKDSFLFLDYGDNIATHGEFSDPTRDWEQIFYKGIGKPKPKREALERVEQCENCGILYPASLSKCSNCGEMPKPKKKRVQKGKEYILEPLRPMPPPSGKLIVEYCKSQGMGVNFAFKVLSQRILDLFKYYSVTLKAYNSAKESGELDQKIDRIIQKSYFTIIRSDLEGKNRKLKSIIKLIKEKLDRYYEN